MDPFYLLVLIVLFGLIFDYTNGFHDAANVIATVIATRVLAPLTAIILAGVLNTFGATQVSGVAKTITSGLVDPQAATQWMILSAVFGAIIWNLVTWYFGIPSSSSYALIGGLLGAAYLHLGKAVIMWDGVLYKVIIPMVASPIIGFFIGLIFMKWIYRIISKNPSKKIKGLFGHFQIGSASLVALSHGFNDAQKSMGIITLGLFASGFLEVPKIPFWVIISCAIAMGLGTATGGFRIINTMGFKITKLEPSQGFAAEMSASCVILTASFLGMPVSSTHMIVGSITGVGAAGGLKAVQWSTARQMILAWVLTLPGSGLVAAMAYKLVLFFNLS